MIRGLLLIIKSADMFIQNEDCNKFSIKESPTSHFFLLYYFYTKTEPKIYHNLRSLCFIHFTVVVKMSRIGESFSSNIYSQVPRQTTFHGY
jgi:hypothetical protein